MGEGKTLRLITLEGKLFGLKIPQHTNLGCLAMFVGAVFALFLSGAFAGAMIRSNLNKHDPHHFAAALAVTSFATGIVVGTVCREKRPMYAVLTTMLFPLLIPIRLFFIVLVGAMDGEFLRPSIIAIAICVAAAYVGAKLWEMILLLLTKLGGSRKESGDI